MTFFETAEQSAVFLLLLYAGAAAAVLYDLAAFLRRRCPAGIAAALDLTWCLVSGALCLLALILGGESRLRLYALLGLCCGAGIYRLGLRRVLLSAAARLSGKKKNRAAL